MLHEEHKRLGKVLPSGRGGIGRDAPSFPVVRIRSPGRALSVRATERPKEEVTAPQGSGVAMSQRMRELMAEYVESVRLHAKIAP